MLRSARPGPVQSLPARPSSARYVVRYAIAIGAVAAALGLRMALASLMVFNAPFMLFFPAVVVASLYGGLGPGLLAVAMSTAGAVLLLSPAGAFYVDNANDVTLLLIYVAVCLLILWLCLRVRRAQSDADAAAIVDARLAAIVATSADAIVSKTLDGIVLSWNHAAERIFGFRSDEILGRSIAAIIPPDRMAEEQGILQRLRNGELIEHYETRRVTKDGRLIDVSVTISPLRDRDDQIIGASKVARDITQRKETQREVEAARLSAERSLAQWRAIVDSMNDGVIVVDANGRVLEWNQAALAIHQFGSVVEPGTAAAEMQKQFDLFTIGWERLSFEDWPISRALRGETFANVEVRLRRHDTGLNSTISCSGAAVRDRSGAIVLALLTMHDVTRERRNQDALRETAERLSLALTAADLGDWSWDARTDIISLSDRTAAIYGVPSGQPVTRTEMRNILHPQDRETARLANERAAANREDYDVEYRVIRPDGALVWVAARGRGQYDADGQIIGMLGVVQNITRRKEVEEALRASEERLRLGLAAGRVGTWDWDISGDRVLWSERIYEFYGLKPEQFGGTFAEVEHMVHPGDAARAKEAIEMALTGQSTYELEFRIVRPDGTVRWIATAGDVYGGPDGKPQRMVGAAVDITERKLAERERETLLASERAAREEAERTSRMKDEFLATLGHELRTPLNAILGWAQVLRAGKMTKPDDLEQALEIIERNARAQTRIIEDLLDMSRIISGKIRLDVQELNLGPVVSAAIDTVRHAAEVRGVRLLADLDEVAPPVLGDASRLQQVFWNLLSNAVKFSGRGSRVVVTLKVAADALVVMVSDSGAGIPSDFLPHVFDRFRQADGSTTRRHGGLGLGLSIVKQLVELHGGTIRAESPGEGHGSTFTVSLPLTPTDRDNGPGHHSDNGRALTNSSVNAAGRIRLTGLRVLVVDDEADVRQLVRRVLEDYEAEVITVGSAAEALASIRTRKPDVLLSDIGMPLEDGYALIQQVRALGPGNGGDVPAVALTAYARSEDRTRAMRAGFQTHVAKPAEPDDLIAAIASLVRRSGH